jgi:hypothetical protein
MDLMYSNLVITFMHEGDFPLLFKNICSNKHAVEFRRRKMFIKYGQFPDIKIDFIPCYFFFFFFLNSELCSLS